MLRITDAVAIPLEQVELSAMRAQGAGGQHVNKASTAVHLRFDVRRSSLPEDFKTRLLALRDQRISSDGVIVIKAQQSRSQERNREAALQRLAQLVQSIALPPRPRKPTRIPRSAKRQRVDSKVRRGRLKSLRRSTDDA